MKEKIQNELIKLFEEARKNNIKIAIASDEEGNQYNVAGSTETFLPIYSDTKKDVIVIAVDYGISEEELFEKN